MVRELALRLVGTRQVFLGLPTVRIMSATMSSPRIKLPNRFVTQKTPSDFEPAIAALVT
jgi:hypothetical protein